jgi:hypothetical protein
MKRSRERCGAFILLLIGFCLFTAGCVSTISSDMEEANHEPDPNTPQAASTRALDAVRPSKTPAPRQEVEDSEETDPPESQPEAALIALQPTARPIVTREVPEDYKWRDIPIMPEISANALDIYAYGQLLGRNPEHISVIGDCQAVPYVFLGKYGIRQYTLGAVDVYLERMINYYRGSFAREGYARRGGFTAASLISPVRADPEGCAPSETPLECEWRAHNPAITFIILETWREKGTVERYENYMRMIVEYALQRGTLPIIITKADRAEAEQHVINPAMAKIAYEYDIPLINFWRAAQYIENYGIDATRDGFHLSPEGYDLKQTLALRTLYKIWDQVGEIEQVTPTPQPKENVIAEQMPELDFQCSGKCLVFNLFSTANSSTQPSGIYELDLVTHQMRLVSTPGVTMQDLSRDQQYLLINREAELFLVRRSNSKAERLLDDLYINGGASAYFDLDGKTITALVQSGEGQEVIRLELDTLERQLLLNPGTGSQPVRLMSYRPTDALYWESGVCIARDFCQTDGLWFTDLHSATSQPIEGKERLVFSPDGERMAFRNPAFANTYNYFHNPVLLHEEVDMGINSRRIFYFPHPGGFRVNPEVRDYFYSPDGNKLLVLYDIYSDYFEKSLGLHLYLEDLYLRQEFDYGRIKGAFGSMRPSVAWSPDGDELLLLLINTPNDRDFTLELYHKDVSQHYLPVTNWMAPMDLEGYAYLQRAFWIED